MSKIGKLPIKIPSEVTVTIAGNLITIKGAKGELSYTLAQKIKAELIGDELKLTRASDDKPMRALHGLARALLANMVLGVTTGFTKKLELVGTGYRARLEGATLILSLGFSHEIKYVAPPGITLQVENTNLITVSGYDAQVVGQAAAVIRAYRRPEPYKGKGIRYAGEVVRRKAGKAAKAAAA